MSFEHNGQYDRAGIGQVWGCVLIGGKSTRMGTPKHLLESNGVTWLELILSRLQERTEKVVISGKGAIPGSLQDITVVHDIPDLQGPLAGILALFQKYPGKSWLVAACDLPDIEVAALDWLLGYRGPDVRAVLPDLNGDGQVEPLLAYYDHSCLDLFEKAASSGLMRPGGLVGKPGVITPQPPVVIRSSWRNVNSQEDLRS